MLVSESNLNYELQDVYIFECGTFYFFDTFIISEIKEGVSFDWEMAQEIITIAESYYGLNQKVAYISNKVNSFSLVPEDWPHFFKARDSVSAIAIVLYDRKERSNVLLERLFFKSKIKKFFDLEEAVKWARNEQLKYDNRRTTA
ncbi:hypothetical protein [Dokdonia donghaensis]|uniref:STAS/SEC14 domain-containing protein n=1 Tax=Dokdonia donghaensis DSW-1 TaxID=1300343 RepID=A0A0A2GSL9_9FLAO|nr:hypothetical protein [Dokdonia donghaensis]ANH61320.1 hypothetical protein I597_2423 [Dokdonia donghaensis DSW-1]KGO05488.1 hypothetical protein NV36_00585 [Dokdonia donghaensis DSW-1]